MLERKIRINNPLGLHARAAALLTRRAGSYASVITLHRKDTGVTANAKSILSILHLAASFGAEVIICIDGPDEAGAMAEIAALFDDGFGENIC